jgi:microcystin degradation protein MlrC
LCTATDRPIFSYLSKLNRPFWAKRLEANDGLLALSLTLGFGPSDTPHCGLAVSGFGFHEISVQKAVAEMARAVSDAEGEFHQPLLSPHEAIDRGLRSASPGRPAILADLQDNPGAGGTGDTTGLLKALIEKRVAGSVVAVLCDPAVAHGSRSRSWRHTCRLTWRKAWWTWLRSPCRHRLRRTPWFWALPRHRTHVWRGPDGSRTHGLVDV